MQNNFEILIDSKLMQKENALFPIIIAKHSSEKITDFNFSHL